MAKKKKKKFKKKHLKAAVSPQSSSKKTTADKPDTPTSTQEHQEQEEVKEGQNEYSYIRKDVRNVLIILAIMLALIVTAYIIDQNTTIFSQFSDWLFKVTNIQIQ